MALQEELKEQGEYLFRYRSYLPIFLLLIGIGLRIYSETTILEEEGPLLIEILQNSAIFIGLLGLAIRILTVGYTPKNTSGRNTKGGHIADTLNTTGLYSLMRNPLYLGNYFMWLSIAMLTGNIWFIFIFSLLFWIYYERIVYSEESFLRNKFGDIYLNWASKTPPFLPKNLNYQKPKFQFSWRKVLKKEKDGLFALFLIFFIFETIGGFVREESLVIEVTWITVGLIISTVIYAILKYLKKYTSYLDEPNR